MKLRKFWVPVLLSSLMLMLANTLAKADSAQYYVIPGSISLRECAAPDCAPLLTVYQGEKVEILERTNTGWSKVKLVDRAAMGWIPSDLLTYSPGTASEQVSKYVNTNSLPLREHPRPEARVLTTLRFNDRVEMLGVGTSGWAQVRDLQSSLVGYAPPRYLSAEPSASPKVYRPVSPRVSAEESADRAEKYVEEAAEEAAESSSPRRRAPARKAPPKKEKAPVKKEEAPKEAPAAPRAM